MKKFATIEMMKDGVRIDTIYDTRKDAFREASKHWNHLTDDDRYQRETFIVVQADIVDGDIDIVTAEVIRIYK